MLIDWFTVSAQLVNFLVLVWLMKRFLYRPILSAIDAREAGIAARLAEAETKKNEAQTERDELRGKEEAFEQQRGALLSKATGDAAAERERLLAGAQKDAASARSRWQDALRDEQKGLSEEIGRRTQAVAFDVARKTLAQLATTDLEACMSRAFLVRLRGLDPAEHERLAAALRASTQAQPAVVRSALDLPTAERAAVEAAVKETFAVSPPMRFETAPNLVGGLELSAGGLKVAWNVSDSLASLEKNVGELLADKTSPAPGAKAPPAAQAVSP